MFFPSFSENFDLNNIPQEYVINKFYELGFYPQYNRGQNNYSCSCPVCYEGSTGIGNAKRCYYFPETNIIYCYHCGWSSRPLKWIRELSGLSNSQIIEEIKGKEYDYLDLDKQDKFNFLTDLQSKQIIEDLPSDPIDLSDIIQVNYYEKNPIIKNALKYIKSRRLNQAINRPKSWLISLTDKIHRNRLILPYYDENNKVLFYQTRDISGESNIRYLSKTGGTKSVFNLNNISDDLDTYFVFEGPFDSCFTKNGIAIGGITTGKAMFTGIQEQQLENLMMERIWVLDSQYLDNASREKSEYLLEEGEQVFIWPEEEGKSYKDFNEMCVDKQINSIDIEWIKQNSFTGSAGLFNLELIKHR